MGSKIQGITVEIGGDTIKLGNAIESVNKKTKNLQSELKGVNTLLKTDPNNITLLKQKQDLLNKSISECKEKLTILKSTQAEVQEQFEEGKITEEQYRDFQREIVATENKLESLKEQAKEFGSVGAQQVVAVGNKMKEMGSSIENVGKKMTKITAVVGGMGAVAVATGANFDNSMKQAAAVMGLTAEEISNGSKEYQMLEEKAKKCGETTKFSASEAADAFNYMAMAGWKSEDMLNGIDGVLNLAAASGADLATTSDIVTDALTAMGYSAGEAGRLADVMAAASSNANTNVEMMGETFKYAAPVAGSLGYSMEDVAVAIGLMANSGIKSSQAGTALRSIMTRLSTDAGASSKQLGALGILTERLGVQFYNTDGTTRDFMDVMSDLRVKWKDLSKEEQANYGKKIAGQEALSGLLAIMNAAPADFDKLTNAVKNNSGTAQKMADTMNSSITGQLTLLKSQLEGIAIQITQILMPVLKKIMDSISGILTWISNLSPATKTIVLIITGIVAAIGPLLIIIGKLAFSIGSILTYGPKIASMFGTIKTVVSGLFSTIAANPVILVIVAIVAAVILLWNKCEWFRNLVTGMFEAIKNALINVWNNIKAVWDFVFPYFVTIWNNIKASVQPLIDAIVGAFLSAWELIKTVWGFVQPFFMAIWENIKAVFSVVSIVLGTYFQVAWQVIQTIWSVAVQYFKMIWENIKAVFSVVVTVLSGYFQVAWNVIKAIWSNVTGYFAAIFNTIKGIFSAVTAVFHGDFKGAWEAIKGVVGTWVAYFKNVWKNIKNVFSSVATFFRTSFSAAWNAIKTIFSNVGGFFQKIWNTIKKMFTNIGTTIGNGIGNAFKTVVNAIITFAQNTINGFIRSINKAINVINKIPGVNINKLSELDLPKLKVGMDYVPYDNYLALLHKGERVLTAEENKQYSSNDDSRNMNGSNIDNSFNLTINTPKQTSPAENARLVRREIQRYRISHA